MKIFGDSKRECCPLCDSKDIPIIWKIPFSKIDSVEVNKINIDYFPILDSEMVYSFCLCNKCKSIFLNPLRSETGHSDSSKHYIEKMKVQKNWGGYESRYESMKKHIPKGAKSMMDAACSVGQYIQLAKKDTDFSWNSLIGLERSQSYVEYINSIGLES